MRKVAESSLPRAVVGRGAAQDHPFIRVLRDGGAARSVTVTSCGRIFSCTRGATMITRGINKLNLRERAAFCLSFPVLYFLEVF